MLCKKTNSCDNPYSKKCYNPIKYNSTELYFVTTILLKSVVEGTCNFKQRSVHNVVYIHHKKALPYGRTQRLFFVRKLCIKFVNAYAEHVVDLNDGVHTGLGSSRSMLPNSLTLSLQSSAASCWLMFLSLRAFRSRCPNA